MIYRIFSISENQFWTGGTFSPDIGKAYRYSREEAEDVIYDDEVLLNEEEAHIIHTLIS